MRARDVIGRRIVGVRQQRVSTRMIGHGDNAREIESAWEVTSLELDNGAVLVLHAEETDYEPIVTAAVARRQRKGA